jgi:hypothetical protein
VALTCARSDYTGYTNLNFHRNPTILVGGGAVTGGAGYAAYYGGGGTAYVDCGEADRALIVSQRAAGWPSTAVTTLNDIGRLSFTYGDVKLLYGSEVAIVPTAVLGREVTLNVSSFGGDGTGVLHINDQVKLVSAPRTVVAGLQVSLNHDLAIWGVDELIIGTVTVDQLGVPSLPGVAGSVRLGNSNISTIGTVRVINGKIFVSKRAGLHVSTFELASGSVVDGSGEGANLDSDGYPSVNTYVASHGGTGRGDQAPYGSVEEPTTTGSNARNGGLGGAALRIVASTTAILKGTIKMEGTKVGSSGGGSGGSVWISTNLLQGTGATISVQGGYGH